MKSPQLVVVSEEAKFFATIGHICLQWALLEHTVLALIAAAENMPMSKVHIIFGGLDMQPRVNMAITLAREAGWPQRLVKRIEAIRKALQRGGEDLAARRNQAVHGVHKASELPEHVSLTMVRWRGPKETQDVSLSELHQLGVRLHELSEEAWSIFEAYGVWKFKTGSPENPAQKLRESDPGVWLILKQHVKSAIKRFWGDR